VVWIWSGAVTSDSARLVARLRRPAAATAVRLLVATEPAFGSARPFAPAPVREGILRFALEDLEPATLHHYALEVDGQRREPAGSFETFAEGSMSFRVALGSCARTGSNHRIFDTIRRLAPRFFLHLGDFHYENIDSIEPADYLRAFDRVLGSPRQAALYRGVPIAYVWDDHDYGPNDADGTLPGGDAARAAYGLAVPHYPLPGSDSIQQAFSVGRVRFVLIDVRSHRDPIERPDGPDKSMLGEAQRGWLFDELERAARTHALVVWANPVPWITKNEPPDSGHGWQRYAWERRQIADRIRELGLERRLVMVSGDGHMAALDDGTHSRYTSEDLPEPAFPVLHAAPLDRYPRLKGGPYSHGYSRPRRLFGLLQIQQFGLLDVRDDGERLEVELSGRDADGDLLDGLELRLACESEGLPGAALSSPKVSCDTIDN
jgi:alkaline phosphatase D